MFSSICALPSPTSAAAGAALFGRFTGTTAQSDFSRTYMSAVRFRAFADRPLPSAKGALEISRFSCMLFPQRAWVLRLRRTGQPLASNAAAVLPSSISEGSRHPDPFAFSKLNHPAHQYLRPMLRNTSRDVLRQARGQDGVACSFPVGLLHPLQHAGLSRRSPNRRQTARN